MINLTLLINIYQIISHLKKLMAIKPFNLIALILIVTGITLTPTKVCDMSINNITLNKGISYPQNTQTKELTYTQTKELT